MFGSSERKVGFGFPGPHSFGSSEIHRTISQVNSALYLLYKPPEDTPNIQILFFHGLQPEQDYSNAHVLTWKNRDGYCIWPQTWLVEEFPRAHVFSVCYTTVDRVDRITESLLSDLLDENVGSSCPVVLVGHSIGGLVIKQLCVYAHDKLSRTRGPEKARLTAFLNSIKGIFFYSTPHFGNAFASRLKQLNFGSHVLEYFETLSTPTSKLNSIFEQISNEHYKWSFAGLGETLPTHMGSFEGVVVQEASARGTVANFYSVPGTDHFSICRPSNKVLASFRKLTTFISHILNDLEEENERATPRISKRLPLPFFQDPKYVELQRTLIYVKEALESKTAGRVVTLSGAPGAGKTSMAKHLGLYYQNAFRRLPSGVQNEELGTENSASRSFRDGVVFLTCSSNQVITNPLLELWKILGYELLPLTEAIPGNASFSSGIQESSISEFRLYRELFKRIIAQKILIILDDVRDSTLLERFLAIPGESLKFLITTQNPEIWGDRTCKRIPIGTPTSEEARHILKNHASWGHTDITQPIQDAMDAIVEKAARHPLVLANVAAHIQVENDNDPEEEWEMTLRYFDELVFDVAVEGEAANRKAVLYDEEYQRSFLASMRMFWSTLSKEAETRSLLLLASMFESGPIPEVVFKLFAKRRHGRLAKFVVWSKRLQDTNFIQVDFSFDLCTTDCPRTWFLHPLCQKIIERIEEVEVKSMVEEVLERNTDDDDILVIVLLIFYGQGKWRKKAAKALAIPTPQFQNDFVQSWSLRLAGIQSFVGLIHADPVEEWEKKSNRLVKQILLKYISCQELDDESLSILMSTKDTFVSTFNALRNFSQKHPNQVLIPKTITVMVRGTSVRLNSDGDAAAPGAVVAVGSTNEAATSPRADIVKQWSFFKNRPKMEWGCPTIKHAQSGSSTIDVTSRGNQTCQSMDQLIREIDDRGADSYFLSSEWILGLEQKLRTSLMSMFSRAGYSEIYHSDFTTIFEKIENDGQNLIDGNNPSSVVTKTDSCDRDRQQVVQQVQSLEICDVVEGLNIENVPGIAISHIPDYLPEAGTTLAVEDSSHITASSTLKDKLMNMSLNERAHGKCIRNSTSDVSQPTTLTSFLSELKSCHHHSYAVSTDWISCFEDHEQKELETIILEAGYTKTHQESNTTTFERIREDTGFPPSNLCNNPTSSSQKTDVGAGDYERPEESGRGDLYRNEKLKRKLDEEDTRIEPFGLESTAEKRPKPDRMQTCIGQRLDVTCRSSSENSTSAGPSMSSQSLQQRSARRPCGTSFATLPTRSRLYFLPTMVDKVIPMIAFDFRGTSEYVEVPISLKVTIETGVKCCLRTDDNQKVLRLKFSPIGGTIENVEATEPNLKVLVLKSIRTTVIAYCDDEFIKLDLEDEYSQSPRRRVLETFPVSTAVDQTRTVDRVWLALSGMIPDPNALGSITLELQCHVGRTCKAELLGIINSAHVLRFQDSRPVTLEGDVCTVLDQGSFFQIDVRFELEFSYIEPCKPFPQKPRSYLPGERKTHVVKFDCILEYQARDLDLG